MAETTGSSDSVGRRGGLSTSTWCIIAAFGTYFCMYAFRKPFTAAKYEDLFLWGFGYKTIAVGSQVLGYTLSKFLGIKIVTEIRPQRRALLLLGLIAVAEIALFLFALTPAPYNLFWLFCNGVPLGMVFGLVLGFLEGHRQTEALTAGLCCSFIVADGVVKDAGSKLLEAGVTEFWMPALTGLIFAPGLVLFVWMLSRVPPPTGHDVAARSERTPMNGADRWAMFRRYAPGLILLMLAYLLITVLRSVRADFAPEIWLGLLGEKAAPAMFSWSELAVGAVVTLCIGTTVLIQDNRRAFFVAMGVAVGGVLILLAGLILQAIGQIAPFPFMVLCGVGLYLPYIAVHTVLFERLIAMTRDRGNIVYLMYLVDSFGYLGYVGVLLGKNLLGTAGEFLPFYLGLCWVIAIACLLSLVPCWRYFAMHPATRTQVTPRLAAAGGR